MGNRNRFDFDGGRFSIASGSRRVSALFVRKSDRFGCRIFVVSFLQMMILLPLHCERGTGFHTYQLLWEAGVMFGVLAGRYFFSQGNMYNMALTACAVGLIFYYTCIRVYFRKHMLNR